MKLFIYSDLHISRTSSILPQVSNNEQYTYRQNMILETGKWMVDLIREYKPDAIVNCGDTFDQHTTTAYDIHIASKFFKYFDEFKIPHYVLVGNHEMINKQFNAIAMAGNILNIKVIDDIWSPADIAEKIVFLPYRDYKQINYELPLGNFLFSHLDIEGSSVRGSFTLPSGMKVDSFSKYKVVFNGHIHKPSQMKNILNIGSVTTHSFSDDEESLPQAYLFDTETLDLKIFKNTNCPLFRRVDIKERIGELEMWIDKCNPEYKYCLHVVCPYSLKDSVKELLDKTPSIIASRLNVKIDKIEQTDNSEIEEVNLGSSIDVKQAFIDFLSTVELRYPIEKYNEVLEGLK